MRRAVMTSVLACVAGAAVIGLSSGGHAAVETLGLLLSVSAVALGWALIARRSRRRVGSLTRQLALAVGIAVAAILAAVGLAAGVMFISAEDALLISVISVVIAVVGIGVASLLTDPVVRDIELLRDRLRAVGLGDRRSDLSTDGRDELADLAVAANAMIRRLTAEEAGHAAAEEARRRLIVAVSHDLRTPLASLRVLTEAVEDGIATGATRTRYLREMQTHVAVLSALIDDLFELSRAQAGGLAPELADVEIGELVSEAVASMRTAAAERGVEIGAEPPAGQLAGAALLGRADRDQIFRVLMNLLDNAIRHTPPGGLVVARTSATELTIEVEVADQGPGITPEDREHVFEAFYRGGGNAARTGDGAGLGLAIARAIIDGHRGDIWVGTADPGARVTFSLPRSVRAESRPARAHEVRVEQALL